VTYTLGEDDPRFPAAVEMIGRTGARTFQMRYQDDQEPTVWIAIGEYGVDDYGRPIRKGGTIVYKIGAGLHPLDAVLQLLDETIDGGICTHCRKASGVTAEIVPMPMGGLICWYQYDPELKTFRRGCE
jgi:hypothetical protein